MFTNALISLILYTVSVAAHGSVSSPIPREPGDAMKSVCGTTVTGILSSDINTNQQALEQNSHQSDGGYTDACQLFLCKGTQFDDNSANVQSYSPGQSVEFTVNIVAPHTGVANVSIVNANTNTIIGDTLISWDDYASNSHTIPSNQTSFSITIPTTLDSTCETAGNCVIQWWWDARSIDQTYMSCVDFTVSGSSGLNTSVGTSIDSTISATSTTSTVTTPSSSIVPTSSAVEDYGC